MLSREMYDLTSEELCDLWCGQVEEDFEYDEDEDRNIKKDFVAKGE